MSFHIWWTFFLGTALICVSPGPNMLSVFTTSVRHGFRQALKTMAGCLLSVSIIIIASVAGVGALLLASPQSFNVLRIIGAAYLIFIGIRSCLSKEGIIETMDTGSRSGEKGLFQKGFLVGMSNPKAILFAMAFFPQFIDISKPALPQFTILFSTFVFNECCCYLFYATGGKGIARLLLKPRNIRIFNISIGMLFVGFGVLLLGYKLGA